MSLYNNVAESLSQQGMLGTLGSGMNATLSGVADAATEALGGGKLARTVVKAGQNMATNAAQGLVNKYLPIQTQRLIDVGAGAVGDLMQGDWEAAGMRLLDSGLLNDLLPGLGGLASQTRYWGTPTPLFGGLSPTEAKAIYDEMRGEKLSRKNLWLIEVSSPLLDNWSRRFNLFATDVEYEPFIIAGDKRRVGGAVVDAVQGAEPVELRLTTLDDANGTLKRWFSAHHAATAARDGTVGVPGAYAITLKVVHAFITRESARGEYEDIGLFRPVNLAVSLSRRDSGMEEIQMTFSQLDTFMRP